MCREKMRTKETGSNKTRNTDRNHNKRNRCKRVEEQKI